MHLTLKRPFHPLWSVLFLKTMTRQIKGDALKKTLNGDPPPPFLTPLICTLNI